MSAINLNGNRIDVAYKQQMRALAHIKSSVPVAYLNPQAPRAIFSDIPEAKQCHIDFDAELFNEQR